MDIFSNRNGVSAPFHATRPFDPAEWLARFVAAGGRYANTSSGIWIFSPADRAPLAIQQEIAGNPAWRDAVTAHISTTTTREALPC
ncbi:hypothetical protein J2W40_002192 [Sphingobium xenophagum]|uniref:Uncharacterized protein n=1 Tax=Sphingobium xenophagum TaxID=121428 RepID=A0ABU1X1B3_SPHXE|nr:hypothetical protein [Sphingobium xenophagum]MDR7155365.1 hypothetical protein [Sphingobium xenophagum]